MSTVDSNGGSDGYPERDTPTALAQGISASRPPPYNARANQEEYIVEVVILGQIILTGALIVGFSVEVLLSSLAAAK
jgi:hypothetical protein